MGQIIGGAAKPKRCNLNKLSQLGTPAAGEHILVSSDNSMTANGQGNFDCYIIGEGNKAATELELHMFKEYQKEITLDTSKYEQKTVFISSAGKYSKSGKSIFVKVKFAKFRIVAEGTTNISFAFLKTPFDGTNLTPDFCNNYPSRIMLVPGNEYIYDVPDDCEYLYINTRTSGGISTSFTFHYYGEAGLYDEIYRVEDKTYLNALEYKCNGELLDKKVMLISGHTYRFYFLANWTYTGSGGVVKMHFTNSGGTKLFYSINTTIGSYYDVTADGSDYYTLGVRGDMGEYAYVCIEDRTEINNLSIQKYPVYAIPTSFSYEGSTISWNTLVIGLSDGTSVSIDSASYVLNRTYPYLIYRPSSSAIQRISDRNTIRNNDILLLQFTYGSGFSGGLLLPFLTNTLSSNYDDDAHYNVWRIARQMRELAWTPLADVRDNEGNHEAGIEVIGVPYSSCKEYQKFVGLDVSLHTFMTAVHNVHSLLYTERISVGGSTSAYGITYNGTNGISYYGNVCSVFVSVCLGLPVQYSTWEFVNKYFSDLFEVLPNQDEHNLQVGDVLWEEGHCNVITKVFRDDKGALTGVILEEQAAPIKATTYSYFGIHNRRRMAQGIWGRPKVLYNNVKYYPSVFNLLSDEYLYRVGVDFCFVDNGTDRTFYVCQTANSSGTFISSQWNKIGVWESGIAYNYGVYKQYGEFLYQSIVSNNAATPTDKNSWQRVEHVYEWTPYPFVYNDDIVTFAGDRASFRTNDLIYINYTAGNYTNMELYKDGTLIATLPISASNYQINVSSHCSGYGNYKARLTDGTNSSAFTYFEVVDNTLSVTKSGNYLIYNFSSENGEPLEVKVVEKSGYPNLHHVLSNDEKEAGTTMIDPNAMTYAQTIARHFDSSTELYAICVYKGYYGNVISEQISIGTLSDLTGTRVFPNEPQELGSLSSSLIVIPTGGKEEVYRFSLTAQSAITLSVRPISWAITWKDNLPPTLAAGLTYLFEIVNGIGQIVVVSE